ncbi:MAG: hypothetical protein IKN49_05865 [Elusimicrobiaceae bacterium]|nr:hypothetical protein [Elusimicrobiaceae bacterium]
MKIINWIKNRSGKFALSTAQAIGTAAVVGVAGIAAWQMLSSSGPNQDTAFSSQDPDVVYVAGGAGGSYSGVGYGEGGELQSHINVSKSSSQRLMERDFEQEKLRGQNPSSSQMERDEQAISAHKMNGASEGLGVGVGAQEMGSGTMEGGNSQVQDQIAAISALANQKKEEAEAAAAAAGAEGGDVVAAAAKAAGLNKSGGKYDMASGIARSGNSYSTNAFGGSTRIAEKGGRISPSAETDRLAMGRSGQMQGPNNANFGGYHGKVGNDLGSMAKYASDARSKKMAVNQMASDLYMSGAQQSGGIKVANDGSLGLGGGESLDLLDDAVRALGITGEGIGGETYGQAKQRLLDGIYDLRTKLAGLASIPLIGPLFALIPYLNYLKQVKEFKESWGASVMETENTQGSLADHLKNCADQMYGLSWMSTAMSVFGVVGFVAGLEGSVVGVIGSYNAYAAQYWPEAAEEEGEENPDPTKEKNK